MHGRLFITNSVRDQRSISVSRFSIRSVWGDAAGIAAAFALTYSATFPAFAVCGDCSVDPELLNVLRKLPSDGIDTWKKTEIAMPGFLIGKKGNAEAVFEYIKEINRVKEENLINQYGSVYLEQPRRRGSLIM